MKRLLTLALLLAAVQVRGATFANPFTTNAVPDFKVIESGWLNPAVTITVSNAASLIAQTKAATNGTVFVNPGTYVLGTNQIVLADGVNLVGAGSSVVNLIGYADCAGVEDHYAPTGGPQIVPGNNCLVQGLTVTCDTNSMLARLPPNTQTHSGTWSAIGYSYLNPPGNHASTNVLIRDLYAFEGYFDCFHFNCSNRCEVKLQFCKGEAQGSIFNFISAANADTNCTYIIEDCVALTHGTVPQAILDNFIPSDVNCINYDCPVYIYNSYFSTQVGNNSSAQGIISVDRTRGTVPTAWVDDLVLNSRIQNDTNGVNYAGWSGTNLVGRYIFNNTNNYGNFGSGNLLTNILIKNIALSVAATAVTLTNVVYTNIPIDFPSTATLASSDVNAGIANLKSNDIVTVNVPFNCRTNSAIVYGWMSNSTCWISFQNYKGSNIDPPSGNYPVKVEQFK